MPCSSPAREAIRFRAVSPDDIPFLQHVYATTRELELQFVPWTVEQKRAFLLQQFTAQKNHYEEFYPDCQFLVIELEAQPIGRIYIDRRPDSIEVVDIALLPEFRGRGIGGTLMQEILDEAAAANKSVGIYVEYFNPARHLYDRLGFRHIATNGVYHQMEWRA